MHLPDWRRSVGNVGPASQAHDHEDNEKKPAKADTLASAGGDIWRGFHRQLLKERSGLARPVQRTCGLAALAWPAARVGGGFSTSPGVVVGIGWSIKLGDHLDMNLRLAAFRRDGGVVHLRAEGESGSVDQHRFYRC